MRYERLVIDGGGGDHFTLEFHPRLTVVCGMGRAEREGLMSELVGVLSSNRPGGHLELTDDQGRHLAVFRPYGARHLVVDIDTGSEVSARYRSSDGTIDLLAAEGLDPQDAKRRMRVTASDLTTRTQGAELIRRLAACDQGILWKVGERVCSTEAELNRMAHESGTDREDIDLVESVERRHEELEQAQAKHERTRKLTFLLGALCAIAILPLTLLVAPLAGFLAVAPALAMTATSFWFWRGMERARSAEHEALQRVGASSYLGFHLLRVNTLLANDQSRRELMRVAEAHRGAVEAWERLAGDAPVGWAVEHRDDIVAAARLRGRGDDPATKEQAGHAEGDLPTVVAEELVVRLGEARKLGSSGESFPLVLDDPFVSFDSSVKPALLELLGEASRQQQIILLTEDPDVSAWARIEAITGALSVIEAASGRTEATDAEVARRGESRLVI